jgi:hypothetical protein
LQEPLGAILGYIDVFLKKPRFDPGVENLSGIKYLLTKGYSNIAAIPSVERTVPRNLVQDPLLVWLFRAAGMTKPRIAKSMLYWD